MSDSLQPHGLLYPWDFPGKNGELVAISSSRRPSRGVEVPSLEFPALAGEFFTTELEALIFRLEIAKFITAFELKTSFQKVSKI